MSKKRSIRGYGIDITLRIFGYMIQISIMPFVWRFPLFIVPKRSNTLMKSPHLMVGCFHIWGMKTDSFLGLELGGGYNHFWWDCIKVPEGYKRIF